MTRLACQRRPVSIIETASRNDQDPSADQIIRLAQGQPPARRGRRPVPASQSAPDAAPAAEPMDSTARPEKPAPSRPVPSEGTDWAQLFRDAPPSDVEVRDWVSALVEQRRSRDVIAVIEASIRRGAIQPWMYEVLALSMELEGRDRREIERVLLSSRDVTPNDPPSLLFLAAYLSRFERDEQALRLYHQVALLEPSRPEPYVLGLKLAKRLKQPDELAWAACGVLSYAWGKDHAAQHRDAEVAAAEARQLYLASGDMHEALRLEESLKAARERDLQVRLEWNGNADLDLLVIDPAGNVCSSQQPYTATGGVHQHDGYGPRQENCYEEFFCPMALSGEYRLVTRPVRGETVGKRARLVITRYAGTPREQVETANVSIGRDDAVVKVSLEHGRRTEETVGQFVPERAVPKQHGPSRLRAQLGQIMAARQPSTGDVNEDGPVGAGTVSAVTPVVGAGTVGYQPVVQTLSEGSSLAAMAVVSGDRRYVRLSLQPQFTTITDVFTFSFAR